MDVYLNLSALYWQATEFGFAAGHRLSTTFMSHAARRVGPLLDEALNRFSGAAGPVFWKRYIEWIDLGQELTIADSRMLMKNSAMGPDNS